MDRVELVISSKAVSNRRLSIWRGSQLSSGYLVLYDEAFMIEKRVRRRKSSCVTAANEAVQRFLALFLLHGCLYQHHCIVESDCNVVLTARKPKTIFPILVI
jgi:hypothetical protein